MKPLLTIALPTYNREPSIKAAVRSLLATARHVAKERIELLVLDNASTDATLERVAELESEHPEVTWRIVRQETNVGYDRNHYDGYVKARGAYVWFCSDRYIYDVRLPAVIDALESIEPAALTFSFLFRSLDSDRNAGTLDGIADDWLGATLGAEEQRFDGVPAFIAKVAAFQDSDALKRGIPVANVSDCILRRDVEEGWLARLASYDGTFMLVVAALLRAFVQRDERVVVLRNPWFNAAFDRLAFGGGRHDNLAVAYANLRLADEFPFLGSKRDVGRSQVNVLIEVLRHYHGTDTPNGRNVTIDAVKRFAQDAEVGLSPLATLRLRTATAPGSGLISLAERGAASVRDSVRRRFQTRTSRR